MNHKLINITSEALSECLTRTLNIPSDSLVVNIVQTDKDKLTGTWTIILKSSKFPELPEGSIPPYIC